jgi:iron(III) transport system permease protein
MGSLLLAGAAVRLRPTAVARRRRSAIPLLLCVPGLLGPLVVSLVLVAGFNTTALRWAYDTPLPMVLGQTLSLLPLAVLLLVLLGARRPGEPLHVVRLLAGSPAHTSTRARLRWVLSLSPLFWAAFLLFYLAYFDVTAGSILAPSSMPTLPVRMYNLMHYGRSASLSLLACVAVAAPLAVFAPVWAAIRVGLLIVPRVARAASIRTPGAANG